MSASELAQAADQVQTFWAPMFMDELMESHPLIPLLNKQYQGDIKRGGDTVRVSQINRPTAQRKNQTDSTFSSSLLSTSYVDIIADQRITASYEMSDLIELQSQIGDENSALRKGLMEAVMIELNSYLYGLVSPSTSAPDHVINGVSDFNAAQLLAARALASAAAWKKDEWYALLSPSYMNDILSAATVVSSDYANDQNPTIAGQFALNRFGFKILEDNSAGILTLGTSGSDCALLFHPDYCHLVMQRQPTFQVSSLHSNKQHGILVSVDMVIGAKLGVDGANKHIRVYNT